MVVLAVTWMAKSGRESDVAGLFAKLTEQSRKEPGCAMYQVHRHKTEPRRFFIYEQYKDDSALSASRRSALSAIREEATAQSRRPCGRPSLRAARLASGAGALAGGLPSLAFVSHQHATRRVALF